MKSIHHLFTVLFVLFLTGCKDTPKDTPKDTTTAEPQETVTITHELGTVEVVKNPKQVVALDYASLENLKVLGIAVAGIPKSHVPDYLQDYKTNEAIVDLGTMFEVNYEQLSALEPDVIFISARMKSNYDELSKIAPTVYLQTDTSDNLASIEKNLLVFADIFDKKKEATSIITDLKTRVQTLHEQVTATDKKALMIMHNNGKFSAFGSDSRFGVLYKAFGFKEAVDHLDAARHGQAVSNEFIQDINPDYLFILDRSAVVSKQATNTATIENELIKQTQAYQNGKVVYLDPQAWYISGDGILSFKIKIKEVSDHL
ncbi:ABC transporter substrate-binding protein [Formosa sediminum]|uniref:ABC transporter substrate-binding protein n=1 Tax=Formosa sediminum TaxID=2594004 RepID=A0A516GSG6_9FLAO|nr:ABC transporter substrate-binding protein [Formosa sediminum]QDO94461.1 ABC transporter substrate-binding protein [Formosa sediminum]